MENVPSGVTISPGVASPVGVSTATTEAPRVGSEVPQLHESVTELPVAEDKAQEIISEQDTASFAESIETIAKTEGVDTALEKLATEEPLESENEVEDEKSSTVKENAEKDSENVISENHKDLEVVDNPVIQEVEQLKHKVEQLSLQNESLVKRAEKAEATSMMAIITFYEFAQILKKLREEEELDKQKKETLLEVFAKIIEVLLTKILVDEPRTSAQESNQEKAA